MQTHWVFNDCGERLKGAVQEYWAKKEPRLAKLLQHFPDDQAHVRLTVSHHAQPQRSLVRAVLHLPTGILAAEESGLGFEAALDGVTDRLVRELKRHVELLRRDHAFHRKNRLQEGLRPQLAQEERILGSLPGGA